MKLNFFLEDFVNIVIYCIGWMFVDLCMWFFGLYVLYEFISILVFVYINYCKYKYYIML